MNQPQTEVLKQSATNLAEILVNGTAQLVEIHISAMRAAAEQALRTMRETNQALAEMQRAGNDLYVRQTRQLTEQIRANIEEIGQRAQQAARELHGTSPTAAMQSFETAEQTVENAMQGSAVENPGRGKRHG